MITIKSDQKEAKKCYENSLKNKRSVSYVTTTSPPGVKPRSTVIEETAGRDVEMVDAELGEGNAGLEEEEARNRPEEARELGIAREVIARETRPKPVEQWLEREIGGKIFKLGRSLEVELQDQIAKVIERHLDCLLYTSDAADE